MLKKKISSNFQKIIEFLTRKTVTKLSKIWVWDPGSQIPDPGVKKAPDSRSPPDPQHCPVLVLSSRTATARFCQLFLSEEIRYSAMSTVSRFKFSSLLGKTSLTYVSYRCTSRSFKNTVLICISLPMRWVSVTEIQMRKGHSGTPAAPTAKSLSQFQQTAPQAAPKPVPPQLCLSGQLPAARRGRGAGGHTGGHHRDGRGSRGNRGNRGGQAGRGNRGDNNGPPPIPPLVKAWLVWKKISR